MRVARYHGSIDEEKASYVLASFNFLCFFISETPGIVAGHHYVLIGVWLAAAGDAIFATKIEKRRKMTV